MITTTEFDLMVEPWIPVSDSGGQRLELGLLGTLEQAHDLQQLVDPSPLVTFGIYRFLAAVLHAYLNIKTPEEWANTWNSGRFDADLVQGVKEGCAGKLNLFDPERPFFQDGGTRLDGKDAGKTVGYLMPEASTGTNVTHFSHSGDREHAFCSACCAKGLTLQAPFGMAGGAGLPASINGAPPIYLLPLGNSLFATLMLNYVLPSFRPAVAAAKDNGPLWGQDKVFADDIPRATVGFLESLTWPPRRTRLFPEKGITCSACGRDTNVVVRRIVFARGWSRDKESPIWDDPWIAYRMKSAKNGAAAERYPLRPQEEKGFWRDFTALFLAGGGPGSESARRPALLDQIDSLMEEELLPNNLPMRFEAFGLRTDLKAKVFEGHSGVFDFPPAILRAGQATYIIQGAISRAEDVGRILRDGLRCLSPAFDSQSGRDKRPPDWDLIRHAGRLYWQELEFRFRGAIADARVVGSMETQASWRKDWQGEVGNCAIQVFESALEGSDSTAKALKRQQEARNQFFGRLSALKGGDQ